MYSHMLIITQICILSIEFYSTEVLVIDGKTRDRFVHFCLNEGNRRRNSLIYSTDEICRLGY